MTIDAFLKHACFIVLVCSGLLTFDRILPAKEADVFILDKQRVVEPHRRGKSTYSKTDFRIITSQGSMLARTNDWDKIEIGESWVLGSSRLFSYGCYLENFERNVTLKNNGVMFNYLFFFPPALALLSFIGFRTKNARLRKELGSTAIVLLFFLLLLTLRDFFA